MESRGRVWGGDTGIGSRTNNGEALVHVRDNGVGFDMKYADKLFGVFQKPVDFAQFQKTVRHFGLYWLVINQPPPGAAFAGPEQPVK